MNTRININYWLSLVLAIALVLVTGCKDDNPCASPIDGESYTLSNNAQSYISNYLDAEKIVFKTPLGEEVDFLVSDINETLASYQYSDTCQLDNSKFQTVKGTSQLLELSLTNLTEFSKPITINLAEIPQSDLTAIGESVIINFGASFSPNSENGDFLFEYSTNNLNPISTVIDNLELNGVTFNSVIEPSNLSFTPALDIKYTQTEGIIFIRNTTNGKEYIYDRKE